MKNVLFISAVILVILTGCGKNDYSCTCDYESFGTSGEETITIEDAQLTEATDACNNFGKSLIGGNGTYTCKTKKL